MGDMVVVRKEGLYCVPGQFYIDPWRPVDRAVITHAHGDHARWGHKHYLASTQSVGILKSRLGQDINIEGVVLSAAGDQVNIEFPDGEQRAFVADYVTPA